MQPPRGGFLRQLEPILGRLVDTSDSVPYLAIVVDSRAVIDFGRDCVLPDMTQPAGEFVDGDTFFIWRPLGAPIASDPQGRSDDRRADRVGSTQTEAPPADGPVAVIGLNSLPSQHTMRAHLQEMAWKIGAAGLTLSALLLVWAQGIRSRLLTARLQLEQKGRSHVEELSLAASGLAHETKNPLGIIRGLAQRIEQSATAPSEVRSQAGQIQEEADRAVGYLGDFLSYARTRKTAGRRS